MADKTPVRVVFNASNVATGMAEFQTGESVPVANGGTGLTAIGSAGQIIKVNAAGNALEFGAEGDLSITNLVAPTNADLTLTTSGTGNIVLDAITVRGTTISSADSSTININDNVEIDGNLVVTGTVDFNDQNISNVGSLSIDSISGDADTNTSITFSGSDVITIATGGSGRLTIGDGALSPVTDNQIDLGTSSLEFKNAFFDGTVTSDAFAGPLTGDVTGDVTGNVSGTAATVTGAAQTNITSLGTLTTLTVDNVIINGSTIGHTDDTDLITVASGVVTVAGEVSMTTLDIGGTNVTSTAAELNLLSGKDATHLAVAGKQEGTNFTNSILVGHATSGTLSSAEKNVGVGIGALDALTSGTINTAIGYNALTINTQGSRNTAIGAEALDNNSTGQQNVAVGHGAVGVANNSYNVGVGVDALTSATGGYNTGLGYRAGNNIVAGQYNVTLGHKAGDNITSGDGNVVIGDVDVASATGDRQLVIAGHDGSTTTTWISGDSSGNLTFAGNVTLATNKEIQFVDTNESIQSDGSKMIIKSGGTTFNLPTADGSAGQALITDGSGTLSFDTVTTTASDDTRAVVKNNKTVSTSAKTIDYFQAAAFDMAWYFMSLNDMTNDNTSGSVFTVCHNNSNAFISGPRGGTAASGNVLPSTTADVASGQVRVKITGPSVDSKVSFYKIPISRASTSDATAGVTVTTSNADVDSASESIDSFAHASFRAAKYTILIDDDAKTETGITEALVVHDGTTAFITQYGTVNTGSNDMITLSAAIDGSNVVVSGAGLTPNLSLKIHKILLADSMTAITNSNQKVVGATTVSSSATAFDSFDLDDATAAVYYVAGGNSTEGAFSVQEVYMAGDIGEATVTQGPFVSTKGTTQLEFTADFLDTADNTVQMSVASTSGGSTTVNAYRINCLAGE